MPRKLEAGGTYNYVLKADRDSMPQPTFQLSILSSRDDDKLRDLTNTIRTASDDNAKRAAMTEAITLVVKGWSNMGGDFSVNALEDMLVKREIWELLGDATLEAALTPDERKKYESQHSSETA